MCNVNHFFDLWQLYNFSGIKALEFSRSYTHVQPATPDVFPVIVNMGTKSIQKQIKSKHPEEYLTVNKGVRCHIKRISYIGYYLILIYIYYLCTYIYNISIDYLLLESTYIPPSCFPIAMILDIIMIMSHQNLLETVWIYCSSLASFLTVMILDIIAIVSCQNLLESIKISLSSFLTAIAIISSQTT